MGDQPQDGVIGAIAEIQRRSLDAASALVERLISVVDGSRAEDAASVAGADGDGVRSDPPGELMNTWAMLLRESVSSLAGATGGSEASPLTAFEVGTEAKPAPLVVRVDPSTGEGQVEVWVHNPTDAELMGIRPHASAPRSHQGKELPADAVTFAPAAFDLPARSSRGVQLRIRATGAGAGVYRSILQIDGLDGPWLPAEVHVIESTG